MEYGSFKITTVSAGLRISNFEKINEFYKTLNILESQDPQLSPRDCVPTSAQGPEFYLLSQLPDGF